MLSSKTYFVLVVLLAVISAEVKGQAAQSPFSTFGIGERYGNALAHNQGMGGIGIGMPHLFYLNNQNPSLLVFNSYTVFEAGIVGESRTHRGDTLSERSRGGNLNYLVTAFPIKPGKWTTSVGLAPYTTVNYGLQYIDNIEGTNATAPVTEEGTGGISQAYWSNGVRLMKELAVGLKASYLFGSVLNNYSTTLTETSITPFKIVVGERTYVKDFNFTAGVVFFKDSVFRPQYRMTIGAIYEFGGNLRAERDENFLRTTVLGDTIESTQLATRKGYLTMPPELGIGFSFSKSFNWSIGADFRFQDWSKFKSLDPDDEAGMGNSWSAALGAELTPDPFDVNKYLNRISYRMGLSYEKTPFLMNNNMVRDFGINFGLSMPTGRSSLDLAFKVGKRGNRSENSLEESYFKVYFGLTINDQWFVKRKFD